MRTPASLIVAAASIGVIVPVVVSACTTQWDHLPAIIFRLAILAAVPAIVARIAYRQGYEQGVVESS